MSCCTHVWYSIVIVAVLTTLFDLQPFASKITHINTLIYGVRAYIHSAFIRLLFSGVKRRRHYYWKTMDSVPAYGTLGSLLLWNRAPCAHCIQMPLSTPMILYIICMRACCCCCCCWVLGVEAKIRRCR